MKQYMRYCIITFLAILLYNGTIQGADSFCSSRSAKATSCFISQALTTQQTIRNFYNRLADLSLYMDCVDSSTHVPVDKGISLLTDYFGIQGANDSLKPESLLNVQLHLTSDSLKYYIFGLRKIVI
jgi:hypothetical protein